MVTKEEEKITWTLPYSKKEEKANNKLFSKLSKTSISDVLQFVDQETKFMEKFVHIKPRYSKSERDNTAIIASLIANGTNLGIYKMSENSNLNYDRIQRQFKNFIRSETLREANDVVSNSISKLPIFKLWDIHKNRIHASVDGQKFETRLHTFIARYSSKYFGVGKGIVAYTLSANHVPTKTKIISANQHESHFLFDILKNNTCNIDPAWVSGDGHSINQINFLLLELIGKQFAPCFKRIQLKSQNLCGFKPKKAYKDFLIKADNKVDVDLIRSEYDSMLRIYASLLLGETSQHVIISKLSSYKQKNRTKLALWEYDKILMSKYFLEYIDDSNLRKDVRGSLNRGEAYHQLRRAIANVNGQKFRGTNSQEIDIWNETGRLLANSIIYYHGKILSTVLNKIDGSVGIKVIEKLACVSPVSWESLILGGQYKFSEKKVQININKLIADLSVDQLK